jgi:hypothetical protein
MVRTGSRPVAGRPPLLGFGITILDLAMFWYYHTSKLEGSVTFRSVRPSQGVAVPPGGTSFPAKHGGRAPLIRAPL